MAGKTVRLPAAAERAWNWFWLLDRTRNGNGYAANRITHQDIRALAGERPAEWEISAILAMDAVRLAQDAPEPDAVVSERPLSPELFDAIMG